ncbi:prolyl 4-hydroxylase subunit alpha-2 [Drosophila madeirensis]|uniref:Prolyl 4-hydroxylase subunit alpha-2 n=2 Tax=Drosophila madeirensis TaxID=30013 RepID=A0AAU9FBP3_DROMD
MWLSLRLGLVLVALSITFWVKANAERGSYSPSGIEELITVEKKLLAQMVDYGSVLRKKISLMRRYIALMRVKEMEAESDREQYLGNPLHSYSLIHHMHFDWTNWRRLIEQPLGTEQISKMRALMPQIPKTEYWNAKQDLIHAPLAGVQFDPLDSLELALFAFDKDRPDLAEKWLSATLSGYQQLSPSEKELYELLNVVKESQVTKLSELVKTLNTNQSI